MYTGFFLASAAPIFALNFDSLINVFLLDKEAEERRSDRRGIFEESHCLRGITG